MGREGKGVVLPYIRSFEIVGIVVKIFPRDNSCILNSAGATQEYLHDTYKYCEMNTKWVKP